MFASYVAYQAIDLLLAALLVAVGHWLVARFGPRRWRAAPLRRFLLGVVPLVLVVGVALGPLCAGPLQDRVWAFGQRHYGRPWSVSFLGVGIAFYAWLVLIPLRGIWLCSRRGGWSAASFEGSATLARTDGTVRWVVASASLLVLGVAVDSLAVEPFRLEVDEIVVPCEHWPSSHPPLRIAVLADLQSPLFTRREQAVIDLLREQQVDLVVFPGDLVAQSFDPDLALRSAQRVLRGIDASVPSYAVTGDVDEYVPGGLPRIVENTTTVNLDNRSIDLAPDASVVLAGLVPSAVRPYRELLRERARQREECTRAASQPCPFQIGIVHRPRHAEEIAAKGFDVVIAGHTHGGQIVVPGFGPPVTASPLPRNVAAGGLHRLSTGAWLFVSRGIGLEAGFAPPIRFWCRPQIAILVVQADPRFSASSR